MISEADAIRYGWTGPCLRASGSDFDLRKVRPYYHYDEFDFDIPIGVNGDVYDRLFVRVAEMEESLKIIYQAIDNIPDGPINVDNKDVTLPPKDEVHTKMESLINHFKLVIEGVKPPAGRVYDSIETPNGELGFYIISDGSGKPYRIKVRPPCFYLMNTLKYLIEGAMVPDIVVTLAGLNIIAGELDMVGDGPVGILGARGHGLRCPASRSIAGIRLRGCRILHDVQDREDGQTPHPTVPKHDVHDAGMRGLGSAHNAIDWHRPGRENGRRIVQSGTG